MSVSSALGFVEAGALAYAGAISIAPKRGFAIGTKQQIIPQTVIREIHRDNLQITDHPVERGSTISDHAYMLPQEVEIECGWSDSASFSNPLASLSAIPGATVGGVQSLLSGNSAVQVKTIYEMMLALQTSRIPFNIYTGKRVYQDMLVQRLQTTTDKDSEHSMRLIVTCRQVILVYVTTLVVSAPPENQASPQLTNPTANSGTQSLSPSNRLNLTAPGAPANTGGATGSW